VLALSAVGMGCRHTQPPPPTDQNQPIPAQSFQRQWEADLALKDDSVDRLFVRDDLVFVYTQSHKAYVLSRSGGQVLNIDAVAGATIDLFPPVVLGDKVVYPTNTTLEVYDNHGVHQRTINTDNAIRTPAVGNKNVVFFGSEYPGGGRLIAMDITRLSTIPIWQVMTPGGALSAAPALYQGVLYAGTHDGKIYAVSEDRTAIWPLEGGVFLTAGKIVADVKADQDGVYFASTDSKLYCVDRMTGKVKWQYFSGRPLTASPQVTADTVYQSVPDVGVVAIDKTKSKFPQYGQGDNRDAKWIASDAVEFLAADEKFAYMRTRDNRITAFDKQSGKQVFQSQRTDLDLFTQNPDKDGLIYAATKNGKIFAIKPSVTGGGVGELVLANPTLRMLAMADRSDWR
jgi:outer membrane protein assembly factor BamB